MCSVLQGGEILLLDLEVLLSFITGDVGELEEATVVIAKGKGSRVHLCEEQLVFVQTVCCWNTKPYVYYYLVSSILMCHLLF